MKFFQKLVLGYDVVRTILNIKAMEQADELSDKKWNSIHRHIQKCAQRYPIHANTQVGEITVVTINTAALLMRALYTNQFQEAQELHAIFHQLTDLALEREKNEPNPTLRQLLEFLKHEMTGDDIEWRAALYGQNTLLPEAEIQTQTARFIALYQEKIKQYQQKQQLEVNTETDPEAPLKIHTSFYRQAEAASYGELGHLLYIAGRRDEAMQALHEAFLLGESKQERRELKAAKPLKNTGHDLGYYEFVQQAIRAFHPEATPQKPKV